MDASNGRRKPVRLSAETKWEIFLAISDSTRPSATPPPTTNTTDTEKPSDKPANTACNNPARTGSTTTAGPLSTTPTRPNDTVDSQHDLRGRLRNTSIAISAVVLMVMRSEAMQMRAVGNPGACSCAVSAGGGGVPMGEAHGSGWSRLSRPTRASVVLFQVVVCWWFW